MSVYTLITSVAILCYTAPMMLLGTFRHANCTRCSSNHLGGRKRNYKTVQNSHLEGSYLILIVKVHLVSSWSVVSHQSIISSIQMTGWGLL